MPKTGAWELRFCGYSPKRKLLYGRTHVRNEASPYRRRRPDGRAALGRDRRRGDLDRLGQPAAEARRRVHKVTASPAWKKHHPGKLTLTRFDLNGYVINAKYTLGRNTGNTFQQTYQDSTVLGVPIAGP